VRFWVEQKKNSFEAMIERVYIESTCVWLLS